MVGVDAIASGDVVVSGDVSAGDGIVTCRDVPVAGKVVTVDDVAGGNFELFQGGTVKAPTLEPLGVPFGSGVSRLESGGGV